MPVWQQYYVYVVKEGFDNVHINGRFNVSSRKYKRNFTMEIIETTLSILSIVHKYILVVVSLISYKLHTWEECKGVQQVFSYPWDMQWRRSYKCIVAYR